MKEQTVLHLHVSLHGGPSKGKEREFQACEKCKGRTRKQATTLLKHSFLRGHNTTTCLVFFLIYFNAKSVGEENFQVLLERILSRKNGLPKIYEAEKEHLGSRDLEELPKSIYSLLWFQLTVENELFSST